ncbi:type I-F CRISPR-associated protein Csy2 [Salinivibrio socompensis]|nr:type I-F CRISPR-associated protein Csy2 [Salinivibrio socompensis]
MAQYLLLKHIEVQNANAIAGLTYGFPAITHFLALPMRYHVNSLMPWGCD